MQHTRGVIAFFVVAVGAWLSPACGGDSESDEGNDTGGSGGMTLDSSSEATSGGASGGGGTGGSGGSGGSGGCDPADCPGLGGFVMGCCLPDDSCGYDGTPLGLGCVSQDDIGNLLDGGFEANVPDGATDPGCNDFEIAGFTLEGCCLQSGFCGLYVPILLNTCVDPQNLPPQIPKPDTGPPQPCGDGGTLPDAGDSSVTPADGGAALDGGTG
jgi:hypothetical protein